MPMKVDRCTDAAAKVTICAHILHHRKAATVTLLCSHNCKHTVNDATKTVVVNVTLLTSAAVRVIQTHMMFFVQFDTDFISVCRQKSYGDDKCSKLFEAWSNVAAKLIAARPQAKGSSHCVV